MIKLFKKPIDYNAEINSIPKTELEFIFKYGKQTNSINGIFAKSIFELSYKNVKQDIPEFLKEGKYLEVANLFFDKPFEKLKANELLSFILFVLNQYEIINNNEKIKLDSPPDFDLQIAGIDELNVFGEINIIDNLAGGDITKWNDCWNLSYGDVFVKLCKSNIEKRIQKNYQKIIENKNKRK
jgi:hypothetical protein